MLQLWGYMHGRDLNLYVKNIDGNVLSCFMFFIT